MERMTLRVASERTARSVTTLRRYIRSGRLRADKASGRYGPEYLISEDALAAAGLALGGEVENARRVDAALVPLEFALRDLVPASLYHELQMKHEQLLVQYGMVRAGGLRMFELQGALDAAQQRMAEQQAQVDSVKERLSREIAHAGKKLREAELEIQGKSIEIEALQEKVRGLEQIVRSRGGSSAAEVERQMSQVAEQIRRVERLESRSPAPAAGTWPPAPQGDEPEH